MELEVVSELSGRPAVEANDPTALTREQQERLNQHKVETTVMVQLVAHPVVTCTCKRNK